jgi:ribonuclease HI
MKQAPPLCTQAKRAPDAVDSCAEVIIHTDGSCLGNPGPGGWGAKLACKDKVRLLSGGFAKTTNNRMELYAAIMALEALTRPCTGKLYTDSAYLCNAVKKRWLTAWRQKHWKKADGKPVLNKDLWERFAALLDKHSIDLHWVEGHAGHRENEEVDALARSAATRSGLPYDPGYAG